MCWLSKLFKSGKELLSPRDIIPHGNITYYETSGEVRIRGIKPKVWLTTVADTNSMDPTVDAGHTCILTNCFKPEDLRVGDVVVYWDGRRDVLHRIIKIDEDNVGRKYRLKGDNNAFADPYMVRDEQLRWLLIGIIY